jgi:hypothetical protein
MNFKKNIILVFILIFSINFCFSKTKKNYSKIDNSFINSSALKDYNFIITNCINDKGQVNYEKIKLNQKKLVDFLDFCKNNKLEFKDKREEIVFFVSYSNAYLLNYIASKYPVKSHNFFIKKNDIRGLKSIENLKIYFDYFGEFKTIDEIIKYVINLDKFTDIYGNARTLFSFYFLTQDTPDFNKNMFNINLLNRDLDEAVRRFIFLKKNYELDKENGILYLSGFFKRYSQYFNTATVKNFKNNLKNKNKLNDFEKNIVFFLIDYVSIEDKNFLLNNDYRIVFHKNNFKLNFIEEDSL